MTEATLTCVVAPHTEATTTEPEAPKPIRVTVDPATLRVLRRRPLRCDWPDGKRLDY